MITEFGFFPRSLVSISSRHVTTEQHSDSIPFVDIPFLQVTMWFRRPFVDIPFAQDVGRYAQIHSGKTAPMSITSLNSLH